MPLPAPVIRATLPSRLASMSEPPSHLLTTPPDCRSLPQSFRRMPGGSREICLRHRRVELGLRSETIRRANLSAIVRELHYAGPLSRSELGARTGLTRSAIRILTGELVNAGLVHEQTGPAVGTPGRPSAIVQLRSASAAVLAIEITVDYLAVAVVGLGGTVLRHSRVNRPREAFSVE